MSEFADSLRQPSGQASLDDERSRAADEIDRLTRELNEARAVIERLPKTADGVPIVPGDSVYMQWTGHERRVRAVHSDSIAVTVGLIAATLVNVHPHQCYSTKKSAEAARHA